MDAENIRWIQILNFVVEGSGSSEEEYTDEFHVQPEEGTGFSPTDKAQVQISEENPDFFDCSEDIFSLSALPYLAESQCGSCKEEVDSL